MDRTAGCPLLWISPAQADHETSFLLTRLQGTGQEPKVTSPTLDRLTHLWVATPRGSLRGRSHLSCSVLGLPGSPSKPFRAHSMWECTPTPISGWCSCVLWCSLDVTLSSIDSLGEKATDALCPTFFSLSCLLLRARRKAYLVPDT